MCLWKWAKTNIKMIQIYFFFIWFQTLYWATKNNYLLEMLAVQDHHLVYTIDLIENFRQIDSIVPVIDVELVVPQKQVKKIYRRNDDYWCFEGD